MSKDSPSEKLSFEQSMQRLTQIVESLERGDQPLEQSLALFEQGMQLVRESQVELDRAEKRVQELLTVSADGAAVTRDLPST